MLTVCAWCDRFLGPEHVEITHGICTACTARQHWHDSPVLVVAPHRAAMVPVLRQLLQGQPEVKIVLDRRHDHRRRQDGPAADGERRSGQDRRHRADMQLR
jgi:hypothetical protein